MGRPFGSRTLCGAGCTCGKHAVRNAGQFSAANPGFKGRQHNEATKAVIRTKRALQTTVTGGRKQLTPTERDDAFDALWAPEPNTGCYLWVGGVNPKGYGVFGVGGPKTVGAHVYADNRLRGPIPAGLERDHTCNVRWCVNPDHIDRVTHLENLRRARERASQRRGVA